MRPVKATQRALTRPAYAIDRLPAGTNGDDRGSVLPLAALFVGFFVAPRQARRTRRCLAAPPIMTVELLRNFIGRGVFLRRHTEKAALVLTRSGPDQASFARYHSTVLRSADSNVSCGFQPSSSRILLASMA
jgi:hypothetical protein